MGEALRRFNTGRDDWGLESDGAAHPDLRRLIDKRRFVGTLDFPMCLHYLAGGGGWNSHWLDHPCRHRVNAFGARREGREACGSVYCVAPHRKYQPF